MLVALQSLDQEKLTYISVVRELASGGSVKVLGMRVLADASVMGLGGPLAVVVAPRRRPRLIFLVEFVRQC